jgi:hypothetical protein
MKEEDIQARDQIRELERLQNVIFIEMCIRDPLIYDIVTEAPVNCYWCQGRVVEDETTIGFIHKEDCLWSEARKMYDIIMEK